MLDKTFRFDVRIYWEDTDAGGIVYHSNYLRFMERARTEMLRSLGFSQQQMKEAGEALIVVSKLEITYRRPAKLDDLLTVHTRVESLKHASVIFEQTITRFPFVRVSKTALSVKMGKTAGEGRKKLSFTSAGKTGRMKRKTCRRREIFAGRSRARGKYGVQRIR